MIKETGKHRKGGSPRLNKPVRNQVKMHISCLDDLLPEDHRARIVWDFVRGLDLSPLLEKVEAVQGHQGRPAIDPAILLALWLYATLEGIGSARRLADLCQRDIAYVWICGEVSVNHHTLSDFRVNEVEFLDQLLTSSVASLMNEGLVDLKRVAQDGIRVRASAGAKSFRRQQSLQRCLAEAERQVGMLRRELQSDPGACSRRQAAAKKRAVEQKKLRVQRALEKLPEVKSRQKRRGKGQQKPEARVSTTDPEARVMKMADGGFRPAYNGQWATAVGSQIIVGVEVVNGGGDNGRMLPMVEQLGRRYGVWPKEILVDGGFAKSSDLETVSRPPMNATVYAPLHKPIGSRDLHQPRNDDSPEIAEWRRRMGTEQAKQIYKQRASTAECVNAIARNRGLIRFLVRGLRKTKAVLLWYTLAHNLIRAHFLRVQASSACD